MSAILNSLNAHNLLIFQPILMTLVSKFMVNRALSDKRYLLLGLRSPLNQYTMYIYIYGSTREKLFYRLKKTIVIQISLHTHDSEHHICCWIVSYL